MKQTMRNHPEVAFSEALRHHAFGNPTPMGRPKTYARHRDSGQVLNRLRELRIDIARRQVAQIEAMIRDLDYIASTLENEIEDEQNRTGIRNPAHFAYSTYAKAAIARRDNLKRTIMGLKDKLAAAKVTLDEVQV
jgi:hypothetical protein